MVEATEPDPSDAPAGEEVAPSGGNDQSVKFVDIYAILSTPPWNWSHERIMACNRWIVINCLFRNKRDEFGNPVFEKKGPPPPADLRALYFQTWRDRGLPDFEIERLWRRHLKSESNG